MCRQRGAKDIETSHVNEKNYKNQLAHLLDEFNDKYPLDDRYYNILDKIFYKLDE